MLFKHIVSTAALSAMYGVADASRCKPRTSSNEPISTSSSYSSIPSSTSTYAVSVTSSSYIASSTSSAAISSSTSSVAIPSSTSSVITSSTTSESSSFSSTVSSSTVSETSSSEVSSSASVTVTQSSSSTSSVETSSSTISSETSSSTSAEPTPTPTQFVVNPGFEITDPLSWTFSGYNLDTTASGSLDTDAYSGSRSFIAQGKLGLWQIALKQTASVVAGQSYLFQYALKMDPAAGCVMDILINNVRTRRPDLTSNAGRWATYTDTWTATSDSAAISFSSQCYSGGPTNKLYYDDVTLTTVEAPQVSD